MRYFIADFETTIEEDQTRVWGWGFCEIGNVTSYLDGNTIEEFMTMVSSLPETITVYFHNLKFDGEFIMYHLMNALNKEPLRKLTKDGKGNTIKTGEKLNKTNFKCTISDMGQFYTIDILNKFHKQIHFWDSLKILPFKVKEIAKSFKLPYEKLTIDYAKERPIGYVMNEQERKYIKHDVLIMAIAIDYLHKAGLNKMTLGSNALSEYKRIVGEKKFKRNFPLVKYDNEIRQSYKGGWTYVKRGMEGKDIGRGIVLDVNSLYPWVMRNCLLPYDEGVFFEGQYQEDKLYPLYIQMMRCSFRLKPGKLPTIQLKNSLHFAENEYVETTADPVGDKPAVGYVTMCLTNVDLELFLDHYDIVGAVEWMGGWKFKGSTKLFAEYIDKWMEIKIKAIQSKDPVMRTISKLMLNNLYGKFATNPERASRLPYLKDDGTIGYELQPIEKGDGVYIPIGAFVTAYARNKTIRAAQENYDRFIYADTDSLHLEGWELPEGLEISSTKLGAWKIENHFHCARFLKQKCYIEYLKRELKIRQPTKLRYYKKKSMQTIPQSVKITQEKITNGSRISELKITCAGMPEEVYPLVNWKNFHRGTTWENVKLRPKHVKGGIVLKPGPHTLR